MSNPPVPPQSVPPFSQQRPVRVGIVGVSGYGGGELLRYLTRHPLVRVEYVSGESSAGSRLGDRFPSLPRPTADLTIHKWDPARLPELDVLFASLPTGESTAQLAQLPDHLRVIDIGGDHRFKPGWVYGLADVWPERLANARRIANPGCYPAASLLAIAPLLARGLVRPGDIIIDAKSGVSGAGRGGGGGFGFAEVNEDLVAYGLLKHAHVPEIEAALTELAGQAASVLFTPHLIPMTRGILATVYLHGQCSTAQCLDAARSFYADRPLVRVTDAAPHTKWASGTNMAFLSYAADPARGRVIALAAIDNLGKGAAGQAVQNMNLSVGLPPTLGVTDVGLWP
ncbi:MAG: N-acetyl-gamma-glutamyl-phosphate reductase [Tepidisphaerales bacterium]